MQSTAGFKQTKNWSSISFYRLIFFISFCCLLPQFQFPSFPSLSEVFPTPDTWQLAPYNGARLIGKSYQTYRTRHYLANGGTVALHVPYTPAPLFHASISPPRRRRKEFSFDSWRFWSRDRSHFDSRETDSTVSLELPPFRRALPRLTLIHALLFRPCTKGTKKLDTASDAVTFSDPFPPLNVGWQHFHNRRFLISTKPHSPKTSTPAFILFAAGGVNIRWDTRATEGGGMRGAQSCPFGEAGSIRFCFLFRGILKDRELHARCICYSYVALCTRLTHSKWLLS